ncbi:MAG: hypothetical protein EA383_10620 [Spirochaetaceae bacterium]|nr:MAG: hypothetical protein EA383_10620 [Spirochaetaceae bacterium]
MMQSRVSVGLWFATAVIILFVTLPIAPLVQAATSTPGWNALLAYVFDERAGVFVRGVGTQLTLTAVGTVSMTALVLSAGYGLSLLGRIGRMMVGVFFVIPVVVNGGLIPTYILMRSIGLVDHPLVLVLAERIDVLLILAAALVFGHGNSVTLREAASVDGARPLSTMAWIVLPAHPQLITTVVALSALRFWNAWFPAFLFVDSRALIPAQNMLRSMAFRTESGVASGVTRAAVTAGEPRIALYALALLLPGLVLVRVFRGAALSALIINSKRGKK